MSNKLIGKIGYYTIYETPTKKYIADSGKTIKLKQYNKIVINKDRDQREFKTFVECEKYVKSKLVKKKIQKENKLSKIPKSLYLVVLREESTKKTFVKVGITSKKFIMRRFSKIYGYDGYILETILRRIDTPDAEKLESIIKEKLNKNRSIKKYRPILESFSGYSECYDFLCIEEVMKVFDENTINS